MESNTSHDRHIFIFSSQFLLTWPSQTVPLINQHNFPVLNSQAGHFFFCSLEHFFISQHGFLLFLFSANLEIRKNICRSTWAGTVRHPCS